MRSRVVFLFLSATLNSITGSFKPYWSIPVAFSSTVRSELREERVESILETTSGSARKGLGSVIFHREPSRCRFIVSPERFLISTLRIWSSGKFSSLTVVVSTGALSAVAAFLLDHQITPLSTSKRKLAVRRPLDFMGYLRLHHVINPNPITASGNPTTLSQNVAFSLPVVIFSGRSSGAFGRMEIKSSSEESQLTMFTIKSRLPSERDPVMLFCAAREVPTTTKRPCGEPLSVSATASVSGPFFPFVGSTAPRALIDVVATLASVVATSFESVALPADFVSSVRANGYAVGTRVSGSVMGCDS